MSTTTPTVTAAEQVAALVADVPDWPRPGIGFKDITPLLASPSGFAAAVTELVTASRGLDVDLVVGTEARGFLFGAPVALALGVGFVPVRKPGKLPRATMQQDYELEYGHETVSIHADAIDPGTRVLLVDDVLATGGTLAATADLVTRAGGVVTGAAVVVELSSLGGRGRLAAHDVTTVTSVVRAD